MSTSERKTSCLRIAMVSDFFYPNMGGVESHIYCLSQCLLSMGHKVIVLTHAYGDERQRVGVRWMTSGLKVYYLPLKDFYNKVVFPTAYSSLPLMREVFVRERIQIVHAHSAFSTMAQEAILHGRSLGLRIVFTDHSLFGFADVSSILTNKLLQFGLADADHTICVSHTSKENTALRACIAPTLISVIPNAVDAKRFRPNLARRDASWLTVVVVSRLVYRKGADLLPGLVQPLCARYPRLRFLIAGDGDKRLALEELRERYQLHDRICLLGAVAHDQIPDVLARGDIFVNTSLTEAFCMAIVEAVCCGLSVVSTNVGGIPEVIPSQFIRLAAPNVVALQNALVDAIEEVERGERPDAWEMHRALAEAYTWPDVTRRTVTVYRDIMKRPVCSQLQRLRLVYRMGPIAGKIFCLLVLLDLFFLKLFELWRPAASIDLAEDLGSLNRFNQHSIIADP